MNYLTLLLLNSIHALKGLTFSHISFKFGLFLRKMNTNKRIGQADKAKSTNNSQTITLQNCQTSQKGPQSQTKLHFRNGLNLGKISMSVLTGTITMPVLYHTERIL